MARMWLLVCLPFFFIKTAFAVDDFAYQNHPIKPTCIALFNGAMADYPFVKSIDVARCQSSEALNRQTKQSEQKGSYFYKDGADEKAGYFAYKVIGKTSSGLFVIHTLNNGGGSGVFDMLLLIRLDKGKTAIYDGSNQPRTTQPLLATLMGYVVGGDRCSGGIKSAKVAGSELTVWQYPRINSVNQCVGAKHYTIALDQE